MSQSFSLSACFSFLTILWYTFCFDDCHFLVKMKEKNYCIKKQCASFTLSNPFVLWRNPLFFSNKTFFLMQHHHCTVSKWWMSRYCIPWLLVCSNRHKQWSKDQCLSAKHEHSIEEIQSSIAIYEISMIWSKRMP